MSAVAFDADVLVVGLGPVGSVMATLLAKEGLTVIGVERNEEIYPLPRAAHVDHEIMRVFQRLGIIEQIQSSVRVAPAYEFRTARGETLIRIDADTASSVSGWAQSFMIHQPGIEQALRTALVGSGVAVRLGQSVAKVVQDLHGVSAELDEGAVIRTRYLVACDGASSPVRESLGLPLEDLQFDEPWLVIDALIDAPSLLPQVNLQLCDPARPTTCVHMPAGRHRWEFMLLPGEEPAAMMDDDVIARLLEPWGVAGHAAVERKAVYRFHGLLAERWREGRILLAGDAAHQMPPFAGQGFCSGVRDAANLAWKLAAVIRGDAAPALLDTYQTERAPHVRSYVDMAIGMGRMVCTLDPAAAAARDAGMLAHRAAGGPPPAPPTPAPGPGVFATGSPGAATLFPQPWATDPIGPVRLDDVLGRGGWLVGRGRFDGPLPPMVRYHDLDGPTLAPFAPAIAGWLATRGEAVLVRPDHYVFGAGKPAALAAAFAGALARPEASGVA